MGLSITARKNISLETSLEVFDEIGELIDSCYFAATIIPEFECRAEGMLYDGIYHSDESFRFDAGTYSGYGRWREALAKIAGYSLTKTKNQLGIITESHAAAVWENPVDGPFMELIFFSDCEGVIGDKVAKKLSDDFVEYDDLAIEAGEEFYDLYKKWKQAFGFASESGCVVFG